MFKLLRPTPRRFLAILALGAVLLTGCSRSTPETKQPEVPQIGVINMDKAIQAHPKYQDWQKLKQQAATLNQRLAAKSGAATAATDQQMAGMNLTGSAIDGLKSAAEQEFNAKMSAKQKELQEKLAEKANKAHDELSTKLKAYAEELDKEYQPQIFNLQLKLQTVQLGEKEAAEVKKKLDDLKAEQEGKVAAREKELAQNMDNTLAPERAAMEQELTAYAKQLDAELSNKLNAQSADLAGKIAESAQSPALTPTAPDGLELEQQLQMKQQEIDVLEGYILDDIRDKTAKVASERQLDAVLTGYRVNISAVDITDAVIAAVKK